MKRTIAVMNMKGGIGKSTTSANIAAGLSKVGAKVLLINADGQNNSLRMLNFDFKPGKTLKDLAGDERLSVDEVKVELMPGVDGIASRQLSDLNKILVENEDRLQEIFEEMLPEDEVEEYDYILFDLGPGESHINTMVLQSCRSMIMPVQAEFESTEAIINTFDYLKRIGKGKDFIKLVIPNMVDRKSISRNAVDMLHDVFDDEIISMPIPRRSDINYASANGINIFDYSTDSAVIDPFYDIITKIVNLKI